MMVGVLALQGGYAAHQSHLQQLGIRTCLIKKPQQLQGLSGLIIPGGESGVLLKLMAPFNWLPAIQQFVQQGGAVFGTCAGMILLAAQVSPEQASLGLIDIDVERNAYGRQCDSFIANTDDVDQAIAPSLELVFIRAPRITRSGSDVSTLVALNGKAVMVQQGRCLAASFHPELSQDLSLHRYFVSLCSPVACGRVNLSMIR